tara:strand:- start:175 stop:495 length:321 start_codon:yes stop_codon:yes gene_type:complete
MALKTLDEFKVEAQAEIDSEKPKYAQSNNERREYTEIEYAQAVEDRANFKLDEQNNGYIRARQQAHATIGDQLDLLYWDIDAGKLDKTGAWYKAIKKVKDDNPKPS